MTSISFQVPLKPISLNHSHRLVKFGNRISRIKTKEANQFEFEFTQHLKTFNDLKNEFVSKYRKDFHAVELECYFYVNEKDFFTHPKTGNKTISKKSMDVDNMIKVSNDQIFKWLGIDDSQVTKLYAEKIPTNDDYTMVFRISLIQFPELFLVSSHEVEPV